MTTLKGSTPKYIVRTGPRLEERTVVNFVTEPRDTFDLSVHIVFGIVHCLYHLSERRLIISPCSTPILKNPEYILERTHVKGDT